MATTRRGCAWAARGASTAIRLWDERALRHLDDAAELNTRNVKLALRRLRRFAREGLAEELDLDATIQGTARNAGWLHLCLVPERRNRVKVLLLLDVGGSMDPHVELCEQLFSAAKSEFRNLQAFYFHNCVYDRLWRSGERRRSESVATADILRRHGPDWRLILVGDAAMSPYELVQTGASAEPGVVWLERLFGAYRHAIWLNPLPERSWAGTRSTQIVLEALGPRMFPLTLRGLDRGMELLRK